MASIKGIIFLIWIAFGFGTLVYAVLATEHNRIITFKEPITDKVLPDHVIRTEKVANEGSCRVKCYLEPNCVSMNVGPAEEGGHTCELNNATDESPTQSHLKKKKHYIHYAVENVCHAHGDLCPGENNLCQVGFSDKGYRCICREGYEYDAAGNDCHDIDECDLEMYICNSGMECVDEPGSYRCDCLSGYTKYGAVCIDDDECELDSSYNCPPNSQCVNEPGSFRCDCNPEFIEDGGSCKVPVAFFPLNSAYGTMEINNRVAQGVPSGVTLAPGPDGAADGSYEFSGTWDSYIEFPNYAGGPLDVRYSMTMLCWVYYNGQDGPLFNYKTSGDWGVHLWVVKGKLFVHFTKRDYSLMRHLSHTSLKGGWKFVGASYDRGSGEAKLWVDGAVVQTLNIGASLELATQDTIRMGAKSGDTRYFKGRIAQMQVYNQTLSQEQIQVLRNMNLAPDVCYRYPAGISDLSKIPDNQLTASTQHGTRFQAAYGRLNGDRGDGWCANESSRTDDWLEVDLGKTVLLCGVATQGDRNGNEWVTDFKLSYSSDGNTWTTYTDGNGAEVEFQRAGDSNTVDQHKLPVEVTARFIRFHPTEQHEWNCLRVEAYGENWKKINDYPVCFKARGDSYGPFNIIESGLIYTFKLVHLSGALKCAKYSRASYWGCRHTRLATFITFPNKTTLLPAESKRITGSSCVNYSYYKIDGVDINATELVFNNLPFPLSVTTGQEFQIWFGEDLRNCLEGDNSGETCADVYAWYA